MRGRWFDSLMLVWALTVGFYALGECRKLPLTYAAYDTVILPTCEVCKQVEPWTMLWIVNACWSC